MPWSMGLVGAAGMARVAEASIELIESVSLASPANSVSFSNVPSGYRHLMVTGQIVSPANTLPIVGMFFNNDQGANYTFSNINHYGYASIAGEGTNGRPNMYLVADLSKNANDNAVFEAYILDFADTNKLTSMRSVGTSHSNDGTLRKGVVSSGGVWNSTAAVTSVGIGYQAISGYTAQIGAGTTLSLYGIKG